MGIRRVVTAVAAVGFVALAVFWVQPGWYGVADPLFGRDAGGELCVPARPDGTMALSEVALHNTVERDVVVDRVTLRGARGVRLAAAFLVPRTGGVLMGTSTYPPAPEDAPRNWNRRVPLAGATVAPGIDTEVVLGLVPTGSDRTWSFDGYTVDYHVAARRWHGDVDLEVRTVEGVCP